MFDCEYVWWHHGTGIVTDRLQLGPHKPIFMRDCCLAGSWSHMDLCRDVSLPNSCYLWRLEWSCSLLAVVMHVLMCYRMVTCIVLSWYLTTDLMLRVDCGWINHHAGGICVSCLRMGILNVVSWHSATGLVLLVDGGLITYLSGCDNACSWSCCRVGHALFCLDILLPIICSMWMVETCCHG